jgi:hypothetical protein
MTAPAALIRLTSTPSSDATKFFKRFEFKVEEVLAIKNISLIVTGTP